jgi:hypothetical protein
VISCGHCWEYEIRAREHPGRDLRRCRVLLDRGFRRSADRLDPEIGRFGKADRVMSAVVFRLYRKLKGLEAPGCPEAAGLKALMREACKRAGRSAAGAPRIRYAKACAVAKRFGQGFGSCMRLIGIPGAWKTNNAAERGLRLAAPDRKNSCGARSGEGAFYLEIMRTAFATTRMRGEAFYISRPKPSTPFSAAGRTPSLRHPTDPVSVKYMEAGEDMRRKLKKTKADGGGNGGAVVPARGKRKIRSPRALPSAAGGRGRKALRPPGRPGAGNGACSAWKRARHPC